MLPRPAAWAITVSRHALSPAALLRSACRWPAAMTSAWWAITACTSSSLSAK